MFVIAVVSAKGGVGKTTVSANLAAAIAESGRPVLAIDLDPQNALRWHFGGGNNDDIRGISALTDGRVSAGRLICKSNASVNFIPYGIVSELKRQKFENLLLQDPAWLRRVLDHLSLNSEAVVILDTPPGPSPYLQQAMHAADFILAVVLADAASYVTLPELEELITAYTGLAGKKNSAYVVNQAGQRQLSLDVVNMYKDQLGTRLVPHLIPEANVIEESLAFEQTTITFAPDNSIVRLFVQIADWLKINSDRVAK